MSYAAGLCRAQPILQSSCWAAITQGVHAGTPGSPFPAAIYGQLSWQSCAGRASILEMHQSHLCFTYFPEFSSPPLSCRLRALDLFCASLPSSKVIRLMRSSLSPAAPRSWPVQVWFVPKSPSSGGIPRRQPEFSSCCCISFPCQPCLQIARPFSSCTAPGNTCGGCFGLLTLAWLKEPPPCCAPLWLFAYPG